MHPPPDATGSGPRHDDAPQQLLAQWEQMSGRYLEGRAELLDSIVDHLTQRLATRSSVVVELGSGTGTLLARLAESLPSARLVGVEIDPVLRRLHQLGPASAHGARARTIDADLGGPDWSRSIQGSVDVVVAVQVLHYFPPVRFAELLAEICSLIAPGGVFVHLDRVPLRADGADGEAMTAAEVGDPWGAWWADAASCQGLTDAMAQRQRWIRDHDAVSAEYHPDDRTLRELLAAAGMASVVVEQRIRSSQLTIVGVERSYPNRGSWRTAPSCTLPTVNDAEMLQVQRMWRELTTAGLGFYDHDLVHKSTDSHRAAPEGWVAIVRLGWQVVVAGPGDQLDRIDSNTRQSTPTQLVSAEHVAEFVCPRHTLGPARLYYGATSTPSPSTETIGPLAVDDARVRAVLADATDDERDESAIEDTTSGVYVALTADGGPGAVAGWRVWPHEVAHVSVLGACSHRGTGVGFAASHRALTAAVAAGLLPQWRVREDNLPSIALAERLGLHHVGDQYSIRLD